MEIENNTEIYKQRRIGFRNLTSIPFGNLGVGEYCRSSNGIRGKIIELNKEDLMIHIEWKNGHKCLMSHAEASSVIYFGPIIPD